MGPGVTRAALLAEYLRESASQAFVWGERDCVLWAAAWIAKLHGRAPGAQFRGTYTTQDECRRIIEDHGGLLALLRRELVSFGLSETSEPKPGDVAVVRVLQHQVGAIKTERGVAFKTPKGVAMAKLPTLAAWTV